MVGAIVFVLLTIAVSLTFAPVIRQDKCLDSGSAWRAGSCVH
jgi:hypothetical protein